MKRLTHGIDTQTGYPPKRSKVDAPACNCHDNLVASDNSNKVSKGAPPAHSRLPCVYLHSSIASLHARFKALHASLLQLNVEAVTSRRLENLENRHITHIVIREERADTAALQLAQEDVLPLLVSASHAADAAKISIVGSKWLEDSLKHKRLMPVEDYRLTNIYAALSLLLQPAATGHGAGSIDASSGTAAAAAAAAAGVADRRGAHGADVGDAEGLLRLLGDAATAVRPLSSSPSARYEQWLGYWSPVLERSHITVDELMLHGDYSQERCCRVGNEGLVELLGELLKYETALSPEQNGPDDFAHQILTYGRAKAAVRGCSFRITSQFSTADLQRLLPCVGSATATTIADIVATGTCSKLDSFRNNREVCNSKNVKRPGTDGARSRRLFTKLPGVGPRIAKEWWDAGCESYEDVERACAAGRLSLPPAIAFCLRWRNDLTEPVTAEDVEEMREDVRLGLEHVSGVRGWTLELVGGGRRSQSSHDGDFLVTHPTHSVEGLVMPLYEHFVALSKLAPRNEIFCQLSSGFKLDEYEGHVKHSIAGGRWGGSSVRKMDKYDHIFGVYITRGGKRRRLDVIVVPKPMWIFGLVGWTGSKQWLRFLRGFSTDARGLFLNSHGMWRIMPTGEVAAVPTEAPPLDADGREFWPADWQQPSAPASPSSPSVSPTSGLSTALTAVSKTPPLGADRRLCRSVMTESELLALLQLPYRDPAQRDC